MRLEVKKIFIALLFALFFLAQPVFAQSVPVNAYFFYDNHSSWEKLEFQK